MHKHDRTKAQQHRQGADHQRSMRYGRHLESFVLHQKLHRHSDDTGERDQPEASCRQLLHSGEQYGQQREGSEHKTERDVFRESHFRKRDLAEKEPRTPQRPRKRESQSGKQRMRMSLNSRCCFRCHQNRSENMVRCCTLEAGPLIFAFLRCELKRQRKE